MKVFVTGGLGFIGYNIALSMCKKGYDVVLFDNKFRNTIEPDMIDPRMVFVYGDVTNADSLFTAIPTDTSIIIDCAGITGIHNVLNYPIETLYTSAVGSYNIYRIARMYKIKVISLSSIEVLGDRCGDSEVSEFTVCNTKRGAYSLGKLCLEAFASLHNEKYDTNIITVRPCSIYGVNQSLDCAITRFAHNIVKNMPVTIYNGGTQVRSWCHINDFVEAINILCKDDAPVDCYNVGNDTEPITILNLVNTIYGMVGCNQNIIFTNYADRDFTYRVPNIDKIRKLGFSPKVDLITGINELVDFYKRGKVVKSMEICYAKKH